MTSNGNATPVLAALPWAEIGAGDSVPARFGAVARQLPEHPAIVDEQGMLTYSDLDRQSDRVAAYLGAGRGAVAEPVALLLPHNRMAAVGMLGALKAGKFYVPLDAAMAAGPLQGIWRDSGAGLLLTTAGLQAQARAIAGGETPVTAIDDLPSAAGREAAPILGSRILAAIYYTSGSTGHPKGVLFDHAMLLDRSRQFQHDEGLAPSDRVINLLSSAYGFSSTVVYATLLNGGTLYFRAPGEGQAANLLVWLAESAITVFCPPVALARNLGNAPPDRRALASVRLVVLTGQRVSKQEAAAMRARFPASTVMVNRLACSEIAPLARHVIRPSDLENGDGILPVGQASAGVELSLLDGDGRPVPPGGSGQVVVRSRYLSPGYWRAPELTAARFLPDPEGGDRRIFLTGDLGRMTPDGLLEYLGRQDLMVKIRGYRVEPEAIERAVLAHPAVRDCVVAARPLRSGESRLIAYLVAGGGALPAAAELRAFLAVSLPEYMIPARYVQLERMPMTASGKVDRQALPPPGAARPELATPFVAPRTEMEQRIADIWAEVLELDEVGVEDNFFELGGDSITALRAALAIEKQCGRPLPANYFHQPTIAVLTSALAGEAVTLTAPRLRSPTGAANPWLGRVDRLFHGQIAADAAALAAPRLAMQQVALRLSYPQGLRWLALWCRQPVVQNRLYRRESDLLRSMGESLGISAPSRQQRQVFLLGNALWALLRQSYPVEALSSETILPLLASSRYRFWRSLAALAEQEDAPGRRALIAFDGWEHMQQARREGRGVVLVTYHTPATLLATALLNRHARGGPILALSQIKAGRLVQQAQADSWAAGANGGDPNAAFEARKSAWSAALGMEGLRILRAGGMVQVANEAGYDTAGALPRAIGGRVYQLNPGFAELALASGAAVLPMFGSYDLSGAIRVTFLPPFEVAPGLATNGERVADLVDQYARFVETTWRAAPASMTWQVIKRYFEQPAESPGKEG